METVLPARLNNYRTRDTKDPAWPVVPHCIRNPAGDGVGGCAVRVLGPAQEIKVLDAFRMVASAY